MAALPLSLKSLEDDDPWIIEQKTFEILNSYLQPSSTTSATAAAQGIDNLTPMKRPDQGDGKEIEEPESFMWETWGIFIEIAKQIPRDHPSQDRLVELVKALSSLAPTTVTIWQVSRCCVVLLIDAQTSTNHDALQTDIRVWTDLPMLSPSMREAWLCKYNFFSYALLRLLSNLSESIVQACEMV